jgi:predicted transcriptional regulator
MDRFQHITHDQANFEDLKEQVAHDLAQKIKEYPDQSSGIKNLARLTGLTEKTIRRVLKQENRPGYSTLYKIYRILFQTDDESILMNLVPDCVKVEIEKNNPQSHKKKAHFQSDIEAYIQNDPCFAEIYFLSAAGIVSREFIQFRFGQHGIETLIKMLELNVVKEVAKGQYSLGDNQANLTPQSIKNVGINLVHKYLKPENAELSGENLVAFYVEGLSEDTYHKWLKVDEEAFHKKMELAKQPGAKGKIKAFTFMAIDKFEI